MEQNMLELRYMSKALMYDMEKGELSYNDEKIQFFLPVVLYFTDFDWLKVIAENTLIEEDEMIVKNFLDMVKTIIDTNSEQLQESIEKKLSDMMRD